MNAFSFYSQEKSQDIYLHVVKTSIKYGESITYTAQRAYEMLVD